METHMRDRRRLIFGLVAPTLLMSIALPATCAFCFAAQGGLSAGKAAECTLYVDPSYTEVESGDLTSVDIYYRGYDPLQEVRGITVTVGFDSAVVFIDSINEGDFLDSGGPTQFYTNIEGDIVVIDCAIIGGYSGASGSGTYATIVFEGVMTGTTAVHISDVSVRDPDNLPIEPALGDGTIVVYLPTATDALPFWAIKRMFRH
jgi:hypothetical protein